MRCPPCGASSPTVGHRIPGVELGLGQSPTDPRTSVNDPTRWKRNIVISQTQHTNQGGAPALVAASNDGADPIRLTPDLDRPGLPQCGEPGRPHVWHLSSAIRSGAGACVVASHWPTKLSPTVQRRCEVINCTRAIEAQTRTRGPVLADRASGAPTEWPSAGRSPVSDHPRCRLVHTASGAGVKREMTKRNTRQTSAKAASAASKVLSNPKAGKAAKSAAASALSQTPKRK